MSNQFKLVTCLSPEKCVFRLMHTADPEFFDLSRSVNLNDGSKPVRGKITSADFLLRKRIFGRNSFQTFVEGTIQPATNGTIVAGQFSLHPAVKPLFKVWVCSLVFIGFPVCVILLKDLASGAVHWSNLWEVDRTFAGALFMLCWPFLIYVLGRAFARGDEEYLRRFLLETLEAREESTR